MQFDPSPEFVRFMSWMRELVPLVRECLLSGAMGAGLEVIELGDNGKGMIGPYKEHRPYVELRGPSGDVDRISVTITHSLPDYHPMIHISNRSGEEPIICSMEVGAEGVMYMQLRESIISRVRTVATERAG